MITLPNNPDINQTYFDPVSLLEYTWNGVAWLSRSVDSTQRAPISQILPAQVITWPIDGYTFKHDLGIVPDLIVMWVRCIFPDAGYSIGDLLAYPVGASWSGGSEHGHNVLAYKTHLYLITDANEGLGAYSKFPFNNASRLSSGMWEAFFEVYSLKNTFTPIIPAVRRAAPPDIIGLAVNTKYSFQHGFNSLPEIFSVYLICLFPEAGYESGDIIEIGGGSVDIEGATNYGASVWSDNTHTHVKIDPSGIRVRNAITDPGTPVLLTLSNWGLRMRATSEPNIVNSGLLSGQFLSNLPYTSEDQEYVFLHSLGSKPSYVEVTAECILPDAGYIAGDRIEIPIQTYADSGSFYGIQVLKNPNDIVVIVAVDGISVISRSTRQPVPLEVNKWLLIVRVVN